jgi:hypothetical protein
LTPIAVQRWVARVVPGLLVLAGCGCGLDAYEKKMARQQKRAEELDKLASDPLEVPSGKEVFLCPPKGVSIKPEANTDHPGFSQFKGARDAHFANVYLGWAGKGEDVQNTILSEFGKSTFTEYETAPWYRDEGESGVPLNEMKFEKNGRTWYVYLMQGNQAALVYEVAKPGPASDAAVKASLNTLALGQDAAEQHKEHAKRRKSGKK